MFENNSNLIFENINSRCKPTILSDNFSYSINYKDSNIISLRNDNNCITLYYSDLCRLIVLQYCIDSNIVEKQNKSNMFQQ